MVHHGVRPWPPDKLCAAKRNIILHVGAIQRRKNVGRLVAAFERTPPGWELVLAGSAGFGASEILSQIESSPRRQDIRVLGYVPPSALAGWYGCARIFAFPSLDEGFGMPVLEAMAAGVPVVTSDRSALPEVCGGAALLVNPDDIEALADALQRLIRVEDLARDLTQRGLRRAAEFSWSKAAEKTWQVYQKLLD